MSANWQRGFTALKAYKEQHGDWLVPKNYKVDGLDLGQWVQTQKTARNSMPRERKDHLEGIGFIWDALGEKWAKGLSALEEYKNQHGDCLVPNGAIVNGYKLGGWVAELRKQKRSLSPERKEQLDNLGFVWDPYSEQWEKGFDFLKAYKELNGDCVVAQAHIVDGFKLGRWVGVQRRTEEKIPRERKLRLDDLGFVWDVLRDQWEKGFSVLRSYKEQNGDCLVPYNLKFGGFNLGSWVGNQRSSRDEMSIERVQRLDDLGFAWVARKKVQAS